MSQSVDPEVLAAFKVAQIVFSKGVPSGTETQQSCDAGEEFKDFDTGCQIANQPDYKNKIKNPILRVAMTDVWDSFGQFIDVTPAYVKKDKPTAAFKGKVLHGLEVITWVATNKGYLTPEKRQAAFVK